jgi:hypothetical protein
MLSLVTMALCASLNTRGTPRVPSTALLEAPDRHVRTIDRRVHALIAQGIAHSPTFTSLLTEITASDVIVYIEPSADLPSFLCGRLFLLPTATNQRYVRIQVRLAGLSSKDAIALIGHELQHAVEVGRAREVHDSKTMARLYDRIGDRGMGQDSYETAAAQRAGRQVRLELRG